jgi:hypothetical protein
MKYDIRQRIGFLLVLAVLLACAYMALHYLWRQGKVTRVLYEPSITLVRVGGVPVSPEQVNPVEVMQGTPLEVTCDVVPPSEDGEKAGYVFHTASGKTPSERCRALLTFDGKLGTEQEVMVEYLITGADGSSRQAGTMKALLRIVAPGAFLRIRALEDASGGPISSLVVPQEVVPYVDAALPLAGDADDYAVVFFVGRTGDDQLMLQLRSGEGGAVEVNWAPIKEFRRWGQEIGGYVAWPGGAEPGTGKKSPPIMVGGENSQREAFEIYAMLLRSSDVGTMLTRVVEVGPGTASEVSVSVKPLSLEEIRPMAVDGWVSPPLRVVRKAGDSGEDTVRVEAPAAGAE